MANLNKVMLIGRLTKEPELKSLPNGGRVAVIRFAVNNRKKNQATGNWEDAPVYLDIEAFNRDTRKLADLVEQYLHKGHQVYIEGNLVMDQWNDKETGKERTKLKIVLQDMQFLEARQDGGMGGDAPARPRTAAPAPRRPAAPLGHGNNGPGYEDYGHEPESMDPPPARGGTDEDIPF